MRQSIMQFVHRFPYSAPLAWTLLCVFQISESLAPVGLSVRPSARSFLLNTVSNQTGYKLVLGIFYVSVKSYCSLHWENVLIISDFIMLKHKYLEVRTVFQ